MFAAVVNDVHRSPLTLLGVWVTREISSTAYYPWRGGLSYVSQASLPEWVVKPSGKFWCSKRYSGDGTVSEGWLGARLIAATWADLQCWPSTRRGGLRGSTRIGNETAGGKVNPGPGGPCSFDNGLLTTLRVHCAPSPSHSLSSFPLSLSLTAPCLHVLLCASVCSHARTKL